MATNIPPYVLQQTNSGFELEKLDKIFQLMGKSVEFRYIDYGNGDKLFDVYALDAVAGANNLIFTDESKLTNSYIEYQNVAISVAKNNFQINKVSDLSKYSIASFPLAEQALGAEFIAAVQLSPMYLKMLDHTKQPEMLMRKRVDVLVIEQHIFKYYLNQTEWANQFDKVTIHKIFPANHFQIAFKNSANVALFNKALKTFLASSEYSEIKYKYDFH